MRFLVDQFNRGANSRIAAAALLIVRFYSTRNVGCYTSVERIVRTSNYINMPHRVDCCGSAHSPEANDSSFAHHTLSKRKPLCCFR